MQIAVFFYYLQSNIMKIIRSLFLLPMIVGFSGSAFADSETFKIKSLKMIGSLPKLIALFMVLLLVGSTFVGGIIYFIRWVMPLFIC